jgi:hypothetical protein
VHFEDVNYGKPYPALKLWPSLRGLLVLVWESADDRLAAPAGSDWRSRGSRLMNVRAKQAHVRWPWGVSAGWPPRIPAQILAAAAAALCAAYLLSPMLMPVHPEGYTGSVASLALHLNQDGVANHDLIFPLNVDYFGLTKLGWVLALAGLNWLGLGMTAALTLISWTSTAAFAAGTMFLVRKWTGAAPLLIGAGLLLFAGVSETSFFFNDNIPASALAIAGLCALYLRAAWLGGVICGLLFAMAVLTRADSALLGAVVPLLVLERHGLSHRGFSTLAVAGLTGALVLFGVLGSFGATPLDILKVAAAAIAAWDRDTGTGEAMPLLVYFLGLPGFILVACGVLAEIQKRAWLQMARLLVVPMLFGLLLWDSLWECRQFLILTPFLLALAIHGFRLVFFLETGSVARGIRIAVIVATAATFLAPVVSPGLADGPRALFGRIANISRWHAWQEAVAGDFRKLKGLTESRADDRSRVIVVNSWNEDRYLHLTLQEAGFAIRPSSVAACNLVAERFVKDGREIYVVRPQHSFVPYSVHLASERVTRWGAPCLREVRPQSVIFVASADVARRLLRPPGDAPTEETQQATPYHSPLVAVPLPNASLDPLLVGYRRAAKSSAAMSRPPRTLAEAAASTQALTRFAD